MGLFSSIFGGGTRERSQAEVANEMLDSAWEAIGKGDFSTAGNLVSSASAASETNMYHLISALVKLHSEEYASAAGHFEAMGGDLPKRHLAAISIIKEIDGARNAQDAKSFIAAWNKLVQNRDDEFSGLFANIFFALQESGSLSLGLDEAAPDTVEAYIERAELYVSTERYREARDILLEANEKFAQEARILGKLGECYAFVDMYDDAIDCFRQAIKLDRKQAASYAWLAQCYKDKGNLKDALSNIGEAIYLDSEHDGYQVIRGEILIDLHDLSGARESFQNALTLYPENARALRCLAAIGHLTGDKWLYENSIGRLRAIDHVAAQEVEKAVRSDQMQEGMEGLADGIFKAGLIGLMRGL